MTQEKFGSPELGDATAKWEEDVSYVVGQVEKFSREVMPKILNRPPGSTPKPPEVERLEHDAVAADVGAARKYWTGLLTAYGGNVGLATHEFLAWDKRMREKK